MPGKTPGVQHELSYAMVRTRCFNPKSPTGAILGKSPANWVWHHDVGAGVMQLIPKRQHTVGVLSGERSIQTELEGCQFGVNN